MEHRSDYTHELRADRCLLCLNEQSATSDHEREPETLSGFLEEPWVGLLWRVGDSFEQILQRPFTANDDGGGFADDHVMTDRLGGLSRDVLSQDG